MLRDTPCRHYRTLHVDEVLVEFSLGHEGTNVSPPISNSRCKSHKHSWEIMVTSRAQGTSGAKETSLLTSGPLPRRRTLSQDSTELPTREDSHWLCPQRVPAHFPEIVLSTHHWLSYRLDSPTHILLR